MHGLVLEWVFSEIAYTFCSTRLFFMLNPWEACDIKPLTDNSSTDLLLISQKELLKVRQFESKAVLRFLFDF